MPRIYELDSHVADLIAAGEVVERPASVIKELVENSIDAGAKIITVEIRSGGMTYLRVTDDGCGIAPEDVQTAFLRHATSKLRGAEDLEAIGTLGFRGEALAAIASVSRIELCTCEHGADEGVKLTLEGGVVKEAVPFGCPEGTTITVRDLFYNTPARHKFMKSDRAEGSAASGAVLRCALSRPDISVRFIKDGKMECHTPGDTRVDSCIYSIFGRDFAAGLIKAEAEDDSAAVSGYVSHPSSGRGNRSYQFFFVNGRYIRSKTLQAAFEQAYTGVLTSGRYPSCVLYITTKLGDVDVNVHPAKTEIRFISDRQVCGGVYYAALGALESLNEHRVISAVSEPSDAAKKLLSGRYDTGCGETENGASKFPPGGGPVYGASRNPSGETEKGASKFPSGGAFKTLSAEEYSKNYSPDGFKTAIPGFDERTNAVPIRSESREIYQTKFSGAAFNGDDWRVVGEAMNTYIIAERGESVWFIDKHAAHERICFDRLCAGEENNLPQTLITPVICRQDSMDTDILLENAEMLETFGFIIESFGGGAVVVRGIPNGIELCDTERVLSEICSELRVGGSVPSARRDNIIKKIACKAAIKAGSSSDIRENEELARKVFLGEVQYCPHGRPVAFEVTKTSLDRSFKRT